MLYPLKFKPILKEVIWGGDEICRFKDLTPARTGIGESWEISHVKDNVSIVSDGELKGKSLEELIAVYGADLLGKKVIDRFGTNFPLLIKFIDARDSLSIQVHPDDALARKRHNSFGKTEMWYIVDAAKDAFLYSGFAESITPEQYVQSLEDDTFTNYLQKHEVEPGNVFFLPAGRVHAIGAGCFIAEIQQTSNITYRIYDYNRKDSQGNPRELHTGLAKDAIDYKIYPDYKLNYTPGPENKNQTLVHCPYFTTDLIAGKAAAELPQTGTDSFSIYICLSGEAKLTDENNYSVAIRQGETVLAPAQLQSVRLRFKTDCKLLKTYIG
ncbi:MAG: class I mannose-6-phosphate isomerase [Dysgonamonadaceae bacterium]|jgi:mannose-6-phosphate isomerase|nr:class I mannose-6-phosphate isomerase [Dysgonamonadaceae bacterium]